MEGEELLTIGVFARRSWLSARALRIYERQGLLVPAVVDERTGYRWYRPGQLETARLVARLRRLAMPLAKIAEVVGADDPRAAVELLDAYWAGEELLVAARRELVGHLRGRLLGKDRDKDGDEDRDKDRDKDRDGDGVVRVREVAAQTVLTERRHVQVQDLGAWVDGAVGRLLKAAAGHGDGLTGPCFIVFHGEVNEDSDGPVEICLPIAPDQVRPVEGAVRVEPAHLEAYTRITRARTAFPQILSAFDAVRLWIEAEGLAVAGAPREVYFADFANAGPHDEVCDVAQPVR